MDTAHWDYLLSQTCASRSSRYSHAKVLLQNENLLAFTLACISEKKPENHIKAAWVLEMALREKIQFLIPQLDLFFEVAQNLTNNATKRSFSKIFELLTETHYIKKQELLNSAQKTLLVTLCFDLLIAKEKVAAQVNAMQSLFYLSTDFKWVKNELQLQLELMYPNAKPGVKSRTKKILKALKRS